MKFVESDLWTFGLKTQDYFHHSLTIYIWPSVLVSQTRTIQTDWRTYVTSPTNERAAHRSFTYRPTWKSAARAWRHDTQPSATLHHHALHRTAHKHLAKYSSSTGRQRGVQQQMRATRSTTLQGRSDAAHARPNCIGNTNTEIYDTRDLSV